MPTVSEREKAVRALAAMSDAELEALNLPARAEELGYTLAQLMDFIRQVRAVKNGVPLVPWRERFHTGNQLGEGDVIEYVERILPEGVTFLASLPGVGKSWLALSLARALVTQKPFLGMFRVPEAVPVIYLCPEMGERAIRRRIEKLGMPMDSMFYCQTVSDGVCRLDDPVLKNAIEELKAIVFLDTAIRFSQAESENSSSDNARTISQGVIQFRRWGARAVVCLHHSPKYSGKDEYLSLENVLRGSGELGAVCDAVWGLRHDRRMKGKKLDVPYLLESIDLTRFYVACVKQRDFHATAPFTVQGRPYLDTIGDFAVLTQEGDTRPVEFKVLEAIERDATVTTTALRTQFNIGFKRLIGIAKGGGWMQSEGVWSKSVCPF